MTDTVREEFEEWAGPIGVMDEEAAFALSAWRQSRREALMEAAEMCTSLKLGDMTGLAMADGALKCAQAIRAAAEENGRE